ncbi:MAG: GAF domain-containing protein [Marinobacter sp.]|nr:GAF domain-containing protein [Marinobacter sp.]
MKAPDFPTDEAVRLTALASLHQLDSPSEERFERLTRLTQKFFHVPIAAISLVDSERQWCKSIRGLSEREIPRNISFCAHAILSDRLFVIEDTHENDDFRDNPLVTEPPFIRFYAGIALHAPDRSRIGTLCVLDHKPHRQADFDFSVLQDLAALVEREFELESPLNQNFDTQPGQPDQELMLDAVTGLWNWAGITRLLEESSYRLRMLGGQQSLVWLQVGYSMPTSATTDDHHHQQRELAEELLKTLDFQDTIGRVTDDQFLLILNQTDRATLVTRLGLLTDRVRTAFLKTDVGATLEHIGLSARCDVPPELSLADLLAEIESGLPGPDQPAGTLFLNHRGVTETIQLSEGLG